jgi:F-BAR domain only protein
MGNLHDSPSRDNRLSSLAESPPPQSPTSQTNGNTGAVNADSTFIADAVPAGSPTHATNGTTGAALFPDLSDVQPPPGPPPSHLKPASEARKDSEGYTVPAAMNDPISQAEHDAAQESEQQQFKLDIRKDPIPEQDADARAALSNVANTLRSSQMATPNRKAGTVRGRRDVRNTMYVPPANSLDVSTPENMPPPSPGIATGRAAALAALSSNDHSAPTGSDTTSIRSGHSLGNHVVAKHADMHQPGLNASIIETVSATLENGEIKTAKIGGEIALAYNKVDAEDSSSKYSAELTKSHADLK